MARMQALACAEAAKIYRTRSWNACRGAELPAPLALAVFDSAVNQGLGRPRRFLQVAAGVDADGLIGPITLQAMRAAQPAALLGDFMA